MAFTQNSTRNSFGLLKDVLARSVLNNGIYRSCSTIHTTTVTTRKQNFQMPERIQRSPTDILKALERTIKRDKASPHFRFHDDPFLIPNTNFEKRTYSLSKESGRKAAHWVLNTHPELFLANTSDDPVIKAFLPEEHYTEESEVSEQTLDELIKSSKVTDSATVYRLCTERGIEVSPATQQALLELLCYYNEEDPESDEWYEERNLSRPSWPGRDAKNTWKSEGLAEELFLLQDPPTPAAYSALIRGLAKYNHVDEAWSKYREAVSKGVLLDRGTFNALLLTVAIKYDGHEERWGLVTEVLQAMATHSIQPDLLTLNNSLQVLYLGPAYHKAKLLSLQLVKEMAGQGVMPSLASYLFLIRIHCRERGEPSNILLNILDVLEREEDDIPLRDERDLFFFFTAMDMCLNYYKSFKSAQRLHAILERGKNDRLIGESYKEVFYYRNYLTLAISQLPLEEFMQLYNEIVPHLYATEQDIVVHVLRAIDAQGCFQFLPTIWTDMVAMNLFFEATVSTLLETMSSYVPEDDDVTFPDASSPAAAPLCTSTDAQTVKDASSKHSTSPKHYTQALHLAPDVLGNEFTGRTVMLKDQMTRIVKKLVQQIKELTSDRPRRNKVSWTGVHAGQMFHVLSVCGEASVGGELLQLLSVQPQLLVGEIPSTEVQKLCRLAIEEHNPDVAIACATHCVGYDTATAKNMVAEILLMDILEARHRAKLAIAFGSSIFTKQS